MNRPPSSKDSWWSNHQATCGGTYIKIKEPDDYKKKGKASREDSKTSQGKNADIQILLEKNNGSTNNSTLKHSLQKADAGFSGTGHILGGIKQEGLHKKFSRPSEAAAIAAQKRHSQTNNSPTNKRLKGTFKGKEWYKEIDKSTVSPSKRTTASKDIRNLLSKATKCNKTSNPVTDSTPCSSSSIIQEQDDDVIDLTNDNACCPICGFTSIKADLLSVHINECLNRFAS